jgi:hypothetical protein
MGVGQGSKYWKISPPLGGGGNKISRCHGGGGEYEKVKRKRGKM